MNMNKDSLIYVAGHEGLIGSAHIRRLNSAGFKNIVSRTHAELELTEFEAVDKFFSHTKPEFVVLAAGMVGGIIRNVKFPADLITQNIAIQSNVINAAHKYGVKKLIFFASSCMYPKKCGQPMKEESLFTGLPEPTSMGYAVSKMAGMQTCLAFNQQYSSQKFLPVIPNSVFGSNDDFNFNTGHVLSSIMRRFHEAKLDNQRPVILWGTGTPEREFVFSDDLADACIKLLSEDTENLKLPINIGSGASFSIRDLAKKIAKVVGYKGEVSFDTTKPDGAPKKLLDSTQIASFGWQPSHSFDDALKITYDWYLKNYEKVGEDVD